MSHFDSPSSIPSSQPRSPKPIASTDYHLADGRNTNPDHPTLYICQHQHCRARHSDRTLARFQTLIQASALPLEVVGSNCLGMCSSGPTVRVTADETWYCAVSEQDVSEIVTTHLQGGDRVQAKLNPRIHLRFQA